MIGNEMMVCYHVMSAWVVYGLPGHVRQLNSRRYVCSSHHWPLRWPSTNDESDGPLLIPLPLRVFHTQQAAGARFYKPENRPQGCVLFPTMLCYDMKRGAQMSVMLCCLCQPKTNEVSRRSAQGPLKKADKSKPMHQSVRLFGKQPATDRKTRLV